MKVNSKFLDESFKLGNGQIITITRGDSFSQPLYINCGTLVTPQRYQLQCGDVLYVGVMEPNKKFEEAIIKKVFRYCDRRDPCGDILIEFFPTDTENLIPGTYYWQAKLVRHDMCGNEFVTTVVDKTLFYIVD